MYPSCKLTRLIAFVFFCLSLSPVCTSAQIGWKWGLGSSSTSTNAGFDLLCSTIDTFGNVFTSGLVANGTSTFGTLTVTNPLSLNQMVITKSDTSGHFLWVLASQNAPVNCLSMATDDTGNLFILVSPNYSGTIYLGNDTIVNTIGYGSYLVKVSPAGVVRWHRRVAHSGGAYFVKIDKRGNIIVAGSYTGSSDTIGTTYVTNNGGNELFVAKFSAAGVPLWGKSFGSVNDDYVRNCAVSPSGVIYFSGLYGANTMTIGTSTLTTSWYNTSLGTYQGNFWAKLDTNGNPIWAKELDNHYNQAGMVIDSKEQIYVTGYNDSTINLGSITLTTAGSSDIVVAKLDSSGHAIWAHSGGSIHGESGSTIALDPCGHLIVCGPMSPGSSTTYIMNFGTHTLAGPAWPADPCFVIEYDTTGNYISGVTIPSGSDDAVGAVIDRWGNFYLTGDYATDPVAFGPDVLHLGNPAQELLMVAKYTYDTLLCNPRALYEPEVVMPEGIAIYPNPAISELHIVSSSAIHEVVICDLMGKVYQSGVFAADRVEINVANLPAGIYLVRINGTEVRKFVRE